MWNKLYNSARKVQNGRTISPFIDAGSVAAAILTKQGNICWRLHRYCINTRYVCRKKRHCQYDYKWREPD